MVKSKIRYQLRVRKNENIGTRGIKDDYLDYGSLTEAMADLVFFANLGKYRIRLYSYPYKPFHIRSKVYKLLLSYESGRNKWLFRL